MARDEGHPLKFLTHSLLNSPPHSFYGFFCGGTGEDDLWQVTNIYETAYIFYTNQPTVHMKPVNPPIETTSF